MKTKILGLEPAFELASILSKHIDVEKLNPNQDALEFISSVLDKLTPAEYLHCVKLLTDKEEEDVKKQNSLDILAAFIEGLRANRVVGLIGFYRSIGLNG